MNIHAFIKTSEVLADKKFVVDKKDNFFCESCMMGKQARKPHTSVKHTSNFKAGEKIHTDFCGPVSVESPRGSRYFLLFGDDCTSFRKVYFLRHKSEVFGKFKDFGNFARTQTENKMKVLRSDNGKEYTSKDFCKYTKERGIIHEFSSPYIHEQNGRAEREIRTIIQSARSMLFSKSIDVKLWTEAVNTACYGLNRVILQHRETKTPFEKWFNRKPGIKHLRVFGTEAYINILKEKRKKFEPKRKKMTRWL